MTILTRIIDISNLDEKIQILEEFLVEDTELQVDVIFVNKAMILHQIMDTLLENVKSTQSKLVLLSLSCLSRLLSKIRTVKVPLVNILAQQFIEKLGDSKDRVREVAISGLVQLFISVHETKQMTPANFIGKMEQMIITRAFASKVAKTREGAILFLVQTERVYPIALKPFVPSLVKSLEDQIESVRQAAKSAILELYEITKNKAFQHDVVKELSKQAIRQNIVDAIVAQFGAVQEVEEQDGQEQVSVLQFGSDYDLVKEMNQILQAFEGKETEQNWSEREAALNRFQSIVNGNGPDFESFSSFLKPMVEQVIICLASLRSALSLTAMTLIQGMATTLGPRMDIIVEMLVAPLIKVNSSSKKLIANAALATIKTVLANVSFNVKMFHLFLVSLGEKSPTVRQGSSECVRLMMELISMDEHLKQSIERSTMMDEVSKGVKRALTDSDGTVRGFGRDSYYFYNMMWPDRGMALFNELDPAVQKAISKQKSPVAAFKTPKKKASRGSATPVRAVEKAAAPVVENDFDGLLKSFADKELDGLMGILGYVQENMQSMPNDVLSKIQSTIFALLKESCPEEFMEGLVHPQTAMLLQEAGIVDGKDLLIPYLKVYFGTSNDNIRQQVEQFLYDFRSLMEIGDLLSTLVQLINTISTMSFKRKKSESKQVEEGVRLYVLEWIYTLLESQEIDLPSFFEDGNVRLFLNRLIPLALQFQDSNDACAKIFKVVYLNAPESFARTLETFDLDNAHMVKQMIGLMDTEDLSLEEVEEMDDEFGRVMVEKQVTEDHDWMQEPVHKQHYDDEPIYHEPQVQEVESMHEDEMQVVQELQEKDQENESMHEDEEYLDGHEEDVLNESMPDDFMQRSVLVSEPGERHANVSQIPIKDGPSGLVGTMQSERWNEISRPTPSLGRLQNYLDEIATPKRPVMANGFEFQQDQTPKQLKYNNANDELIGLVEMMAKSLELEETFGRMYQLSRKYPCNALDKSGSDFWDSNFIDVLYSVIEKTDESYQEKIQEMALVLLKSLIMNQSDLVLGHEHELLQALFSTRSDGSPEISGASESALIALLGIYEPKECIDLLLSLRENWDLRNPKSSAYKIRPNQYQYRPLPIASLFYGIQKAMSRFEVENVDIVWLSEIVFPELSSIHVTVRKAAYDCLVQCAMLLQTQFWQIAHNVFSAPQTKLISGILKKRQELATPF